MVRNVCDDGRVQYHLPFSTISTLFFHLTFPLASLTLFSLITMGRGRSCYISYTAFVLLSTVPDATAGSIWDVHILEGPAPSPAKGPPFSAHASRNPALIPYQIIGIVGAYIGSVLIVGSLLLTVGRKLRKKAQKMACEPTEMFKPQSTAFGRSPASPTGGRHWYSPRRLADKRSMSSSVQPVTSNQVSPGLDSVASFDNSVLEADRRKREAEMERLYAAVLAQDESQDPDGIASTVPTVDMPPEYSSKASVRPINYDPNLRQGPSYTSTPRGWAPESLAQAMYATDPDLPFDASSPKSPLQSDYSRWAPSQQDHARNVYARGDSEPNSARAKHSPPKKTRKSLRNIKISGPIMRDDDDSGDDRTPLSPRFYANPGTPPEPPAKDTPRVRTFQSGGISKGDQARDLALLNAQIPSEQVMANAPRTMLDAGTTQRAGPSRAGARGNGVLPLREMNRQYAQQAQTSHATTFPLSPGHWNATSPTHGKYAMSAGPVKTTFLEARRDQFAGPRTGLPTPYSPYMPFTPLTPVTPHLTSKAERKQKEREEKRFQKPIMEEDAVADEKELWSSGY